MSKLCALHGACVMSCFCSFECLRVSVCVIVPNEARENKNTTARKEREREYARVSVENKRRGGEREKNSLRVCVCVEPNEHKRSVLGGEGYTKNLTTVLCRRR